MLSWVETDIRAINHNIKVFRNIVGTKRLLMPVIKSNAYGHGFELVAGVCEKNAFVDRMCVVSLGEALRLRKIGVKKPIIVLGLYELDQESLREALKKRIILPLYTIEQAKAVNAIAKQLRKKIVMHLKIDTGTSRIGVLPEQVLEFITQLRKCANITIEGIWSHFSSSENDEVTTKVQYALLNRVDEQLRKAGITIPLKHMACSASTMLYQPNGCNAVRFGIGLYGLHPDASTRSKAVLKPALSWKTKVQQVKIIPKGVKISYGGTYTTTRKTKLAVLPVGYWDGLPRSLSNKAHVLIRGKRCPIRGRICMNLTMVDVTSLPVCSAGDTVTLIGKDKKQTITADQLAAYADTINYEIVTRINPLIERISV